MLEVEDEFGTKYSVLLSKTYESEKELVPEKKGKVRVTGFKQFVAIVDTPKGSFHVLPSQIEITDFGSKSEF